MYYMLYYMSARLHDYTHLKQKIKIDKKYGQKMQAKKKSGCFARRHKSATEADKQPSARSLVCHTRVKGGAEVRRNRARFAAALINKNEPRRRGAQRPKRARRPTDSSSKVAHASSHEKGSVQRTRFWPLFAGRVIAVLTDVARPKNLAAATTTC